MSPNPLLAGLKPTHPGEFLREIVLPALGRSKVEIAKLLGVSRRQLYNILDEAQPITPQMALRIGKLTGTTPESWLAMQQAYDLRLAEKELSGALKQIPQLEAAAAG
jgi:addiction module HigA family antidote